MTPVEREIEEEGSAGYQRTVAFSDGVFAIAITLLVLALEVPDVPEGGTLTDALRDLGGQVWSYFVGFGVIGAFWLGHHRFFDMLRRFDSTLLLLNLAFLSLISLMPFTTGVFGRYGDEHAAVILYAANVAAASAVDTLMLWVALRRGILDPAFASARGMPAQLARSFFPGFVFLCSIPIALIEPHAAPWTWIALLVVGPFVLRARRHRESPIS
jgi:TMEM175 potassium channel family protein